jgi:hypothetical protein
MNPRNKPVLAVLVAVLLLGISGCGNTANPETTGNQDVQGLGGNAPGNASDPGFGADGTLSLTRDQMVARATAFITYFDAENKRVPYSWLDYWDTSTNTLEDQGGPNRYRLDCSGFVSAAWGGSTSDWTGTMIYFPRVPSVQELDAGDALVVHNGDRQHVVFVARKATDRGPDVFEIWEEAGTLTGATWSIARLTDLGDSRVDMTVLESEAPRELWYAPFLERWYNDPRASKTSERPIIGQQITGTRTGYTMIRSPGLVDSPAPTPIPPTPVPPTPVPPTPSVNVAFDSRTFVNLGGELIESITAYGRYWNFVGDGVWKDGNGLPLGGVPRYAAGPCAGHPNDCTFDSRTFVTLGGQLVESITAYGKYFNFVDDDPWPIAPSGNLAGVTRYANGPCRGQGSSCRFDTRTFVELGGQLVESITANGMYFNFIGDAPWPIAPSGYLGVVGRYSPICARAPARAPCTFNSRTFVELGGQLVESITAYGMYFNFVGDAPWPIAPSGRLDSVGRYAHIKP